MLNVWPGTTNDLPHGADTMNLFVQRMIPGVRVGTVLDGLVTLPAGVHLGGGSAAAAQRAAAHGARRRGRPAGRRCLPAQSLWPQAPQGAAPATAQP